MPHAEIPEAVPAGLDFLGSEDATAFVPVYNFQAEHRPENPIEFGTK